MKSTSRIHSLDLNSLKLFVDSGAHALYSDWVMKVHGPVTAGGDLTSRMLTSRLKTDVYGRYESDEFWQYVEGYCEWLKENKSIDWYVSVDVIFNPELSWKVLKYMEDKHGLSPMPVVHWGTPLEWVRKHLKEGYDLLGLGGLGQEANKSRYRRWADEVYQLLCPLPKRLPVVRTHGFAMTSFDLLVRYPWWSVDSTSWVKMAAYGGVYIPRYNGGCFDFLKPPLVVCVSTVARKKGKAHFVHLTETVRGDVLRWLDYVGVPMGSTDESGEEIEWGVSSNHEARSLVNLKYFMGFAESLPEWPWAFDVKVVNRGFVQ